MTVSQKKILSKTQSICSVCRRPVDAFYVEHDGRVFFEKNCTEHGMSSTIVSGSADDYKEWIKNPVINIPPEKPLTSGDPDDASCPLHCGTCGNHLQTACCVLIDITDRCNQHCPYCFAGSGKCADSSREPSLEEIESKYDLLLRLGEERPFNIQLSGGEPTVRDDLPEIIRMAKDKGFEYVQINSNGRRIAEEEDYAQKLRDAGASVIFMQFDGTDDEIYMKLRNEPLFDIKKRAVRNCEKAGLPVTLVPTVVNGVNSDNIGAMMDFLLENINVVKGIHFQPVSFFGRHPQHQTDGNFPGRMTMFDLLRELEKQKPEFRYEDFCPISTGHTLCCFYSTYIREPDGSARCTLTKAQKEGGISCCGTSTADKGEVIRRDRDFVLNKWEIAPASETAAAAEQKHYRSSLEITAFDEFLQYYRRNSFTVTGMAFQDITNLDAERVKRCRVQVLSEDNRLIPFCAYNSIYREKTGGMG